MDAKSLVVEGKKIGSTSEFLDNFYASLPSRFLKKLFYDSLKFSVAITT